MHKTITLNDFQWQQHEYDIEVTYSPFRYNGTLDPPDYAQLECFSIDGITKEEHNLLENNEAFCDAVLDAAIEENDMLNDMYDEEEC